MPIVPLCKRAQRRSPQTSPSSTHATNTPRLTSAANSVVVTDDSCCLICRKDIKYFADVLICGHQYHADCYWKWISFRSNLPSEKSICPRCGFLDVQTDKKMLFGDKKIKKVVRMRKRSTSSSSSDSDSSMASSSTSSSTSSSSSSSSCSSKQDMDFFFI